MLPAKSLLSSEILYDPDARFSEEEIEAARWETYEECRLGGMDGQSSRIVAEMSANFLRRFNARQDLNK